MDCIFCKIANNQSWAHKVYEDDKVVAFLDKHPINPGHTLTIPKKHEPDFFNLEEKIYLHLMTIAQKLAKIVSETINPKKVGLVVAGLDIPHTHIHIIPMHNYYDVTSKSILEGKRANPSDEELASMAEKLKKEMHYIF